MPVYIVSTKRKEWMTMRTLASFLMISLDGYFEGRNPWELDWHNVDAEFNDFAIAQLDASDCIIFGRATYQGMAQYWPTPQVIEEDPQVASRMNQKPKLLVSATLERPEPQWSNTRLVSDPAADLARLKQQPGKDLLVLGSSKLTASLTDMGLLDELRIIVNPVIVAEGHSLFAGAARRTPLELLSTRGFKSGNVLLTYKPRHDSQ
jgi:dihydrofolate reductase